MRAKSHSSWWAMAWGRGAGGVDRGKGLQAQGSGQNSGSIFSW